MEHYCVKCLVNRVEHEGDVCAACRGNEKLDSGSGTQRSTIQGSPANQRKASVLYR